MSEQYQDIPWINTLESLLESSGMEINSPPPSKAKRRKVSKACVSCRKAHVSCDDNRPCTRCVNKGLADQCRDEPRTKPPDSRHSRNIPIAPKMENKDINFFEMFSQMQSLPMDNPSEIFNSLSINPANRDPNAIIALPNCFSNPTSSISSPMLSMEELEHLFPKKDHLCSSKGLAGCDDCSFNIANALPQPKMLPNYSNNPFQIGYSTSPTVKTSQIKPSPTNIGSLDYRSTSHLEPILKNLSIEVPIISHISFLVQKLYKQETRLESLEHYAQLFTTSFLATPSCIFSSSGLIFDCNDSFLKLIQQQKPEMVGECIFSYMDMSSILSILDIATKPGHSGFGKCNFSKKYVHKTCTSSISIFKDRDIVWVLAQFIPI
ncbi:Transcriptional regulator of nonfermentable carbon utilization [Boothiomyces macroporosus]|uniref:Transcriptional regulator of nonfermentable carbon utilization n=1 Tax=Boothiomyces macroporosus TaxID=261099 RepID=A0AAD5UCR9_9FUNG|nr:Transcriptional regulator of nonfermentable carbon utilization [Boothiomyces macroporosus]